jgi:hypothetical protein
VNAAVIHAFALEPSLPAAVRTRMIPRRMLAHCTPRLAGIFGLIAFARWA